MSGLHDLGLPVLVRSLSCNQLPSTVRKLPFCDWVDWLDSFRLASTASSVLTAGLGDLRLVSDLDLSSLSLFFTASKIPCRNYQVRKNLAQGIASNYLICLQLRQESCVRFNAAALFLDKVNRLLHVPVVSFHGVGDYYRGRSANSHFAVHQNFGTLLSENNLNLDNWTSKLLTKLTLLC